MKVTEIPFESVPGAHTYTFAGPGDYVVLPAVFKGTTLRFDSHGVTMTAKLKGKPEDVQRIVKVIQEALMGWSEIE